MNIWTILLTVFTISFLALVHELGHYLTARKFNVAIKEFAVGMGPKIISRTSKKTGIVYSLRLFPIGGFVAMVGEDEESDDENALSKKPVWQRMIITAAGSVMNIITGIVVMALLVTFAPKLYGTTIIGPKIYNTDAGQKEFNISFESGLEIGDEIIKVGGDRVHILDELDYEIMHDATKPIDIVVRRDGKIITLKNVIFSTTTMDGVTFAIPDFETAAEDKNVFSVIKHAFFGSLSTVKMVWEALIDLISGKYGLDAVSGPVGVATVVSDAAKIGAEPFFELVVMIAMNLGVFNLLPFPALDGGRLVFQVIELIRRKPLKPEVEGYVHFVGIVLLLLLMVVITFKDIFKLIV